LAIKNGWTLHYDDWRVAVNCLAIDADWVLAVMTSYPGDLGLSYGSQLCADGDPADPRPGCRLTRRQLTDATGRW
jgi:hypothetical protein